MSKESNFNNKSILPSLYRLIKSLTQTQKRDFKKFARFWSTDKEQKYIALFVHINQYIAAQKELTALATDLAAHPKFRSSSINTLAHYLFDKIMDSVRGTPGTTPPRHNRMFQAFHDIHFLFYKELYAECFKVIKEAKKLAHEMDRPVYILELQIWQARITARLSNISWRLEEMQEEQQQTLDIIEATYTTFLKAQRLLVAAKTNDTGVLSKEIMDIMDAVRNKQDDELEQISPRLHYWRLVEAQHCYELQSIVEQKNTQEEDSSQKNLSGALHQLKTNLNFMSDKGKVIAEEEPVIYISTLENYLAHCLKLKDEEGIKKLESVFINNNDKKEEIHRYRSIIYYRMLNYIRFNRFKEACDYLEGQKLEENLQSRQHLISDNRMSAIRYCCVQAYFLNENYEMANNWANYIINNPRGQSLPLTFLLSELIEAICRLELKTLRSSSSYIEALIRKHKRREPNNKFLHDLLMAMKYAAMQPQSTVLKEIIKRRNKLETELNKNKALLIFGPVLAWLDSRISEKTLAEEILKYN